MLYGMIRNPHRYAWKLLQMISACVTWNLVAAWKSLQTKRERRQSIRYGKQKCPITHLQQRVYDLCQRLGAVELWLSILSAFGWATCCGYQNSQVRIVSRTPRKIQQSCSLLKKRTVSKINAAKNAEKKPENKISKDGGPFWPYMCPKFLMIFAANNFLDPLMAIFGHAQGYWNLWRRNILNLCNKTRLEHKSFCLAIALCTLP